MSPAGDSYISGLYRRIRCQILRCGLPGFCLKSLITGKHRNRTLCKISIRGQLNLTVLPADIASVAIDCAIHLYLINQIFSPEVILQIHILPSAVTIVTSAGLLTRRQLGKVFT